MVNLVRIDTIRSDLAFRIDNREIDKLGMGVVAAACTATRGFGPIVFTVTTPHHPEQGVGSPMLLNVVADEALEASARALGNKK